MKLTLGVALGALLVGLGALQATGVTDGYYSYFGAAIAVLGAVLAYLHAQGVDGAESPPGQAPP